MVERILRRMAILANGESVTIEAAAGKYGLLQSYLESPDLEWDPLYYLRQVSFGNPIEPEQVRTLAAAGLLSPEGLIDPVMRAVILSAVRGEGHVLHLDSPFTDPVDRAIADFISARDYLFASLPESDFNELVSHDVKREMNERLQEQSEDEPLPLSLQDKRALAERLWKVAEESRRSKRSEDPDAPPR